MAGNKPSRHGAILPFALADRNRALLRASASIFRRFENTARNAWRTTRDPNGGRTFRLGAKIRMYL